jgi:pimeloyl-ACP methyl ester carboxylesterase
MSKVRVLVVWLLVVGASPLLRADDFFFDSAGIKIHYTVEGKGEPVILVHGFSASILMNWGAPGVIKALADQYQVIALDNRGHGQSDKPHAPSAYGPEMANDVVRLMDHLGLRKAHIVGYSMGGFITNYLLATHPERFVTATLGGAGWQDPGDAAPLEELAKSLEEGKGIGPLVVALTPKGQPPPTAQAIEAANTIFMAGNDPLALAAAARGLSLSVLESQLRANKVPVLALIGELDPLKAGVDRMDGVVPGLQVVVIPRATHISAFAQPLFISSLKSFLAAHPAGQ